MLDEVLHGLAQNQKTIPSKYFYDEKGSELFRQICRLEEYYLTRAEIEIMRDCSYEIVKIIGKNCLIIELGCGNSNKIRLLLNHLIPAVYIPIDISENTMKNFVEFLQNDYPKLKIISLCTDFTQEFKVPELDITYSKKIVYFPGSTIGNFTKSEAYNFLRRINKICKPNGGLLIGIDLKKDKATLEAAYNDKKGITAEFNLNILRHINDELNANFNINNFEHKAIYNEKEGQIEMYLISRCEQKVQIGNKIIFFDKDEPVLTEISCKYSLNEFREMVSGLFEVQKVWTDEQQKFSVQFLRVKS